MTETTTEESAPAAPADQAATTADTVAATPLVTADLLVEDVSIDGMCGVY
jgi:mycofactocin precursor